MTDPTRPLRRAIRAHLHQLKLRRELQSYSRLFQERKLSIPDEFAIQQKLRAKFPHQTARKKGGLSIVSIYHNYNWEESAFLTSLAAFGDVRHIDWKDPSLTGGLQPSDSGWQQNMNQSLLEKIDVWNRSKPIDVIFCYLSGAQIDVHFLGKLRGIGARIVNLFLNDKEAFVGKVRNGRAQGMRDICRGFDLCWTSTRDALEKYAVEGARVVYLPEGANPEVHKPYPEEKTIDISFVGQCYGNRPEVIERLEAAGVDVKAFGPGWPNGPLSTEEMVKTWSRSRINLGFAGVSNLKGVYCLKGRDFEIPMSGGLYLTEHHEELGEFFQIGEEIVTYTGFEDLLNKVNWLIKNPLKSEEIRVAGYRRAIEEHTWEKRFEQIFRLTGALE